MEKYLEIIGMVILFIGVALIPASVLTVDLHDPVLTACIFTASLPIIGLGAWILCKGTELE